MPGLTSDRDRMSSIFGPGLDDLIASNARAGRLAPPGSTTAKGYRNENGGSGCWRGRSVPNTGAKPTKFAAVGILERHVLNQMGKPQDTFL
jgi:hypothetical protein